MIVLLGSRYGTLQPYPLMATIDLSVTKVRG